ncbi:MAG: hypothetical protein OXN17_01985, partial [Candidatus Poribacteria bacterium]|nr:hypothetical protein [Candidatus Poribacteria bacterium]
TKYNLTEFDRYQLVAYAVAIPVLNPYFVESRCGWKPHLPWGTKYNLTEFDRYQLVAYAVVKPLLTPYFVDSRCGWKPHLP